MKRKRDTGIETDEKTEMDNPPIEKMKYSSLITCPLTGKVFCDPIVDRAGITYEREVYWRKIEEESIGVYPIIDIIINKSMVDYLATLTIDDKYVPSNLYVDNKFIIHTLIVNYEDDELLTHLRGYRGFDLADVYRGEKFIKFALAYIKNPLCINLIRENRLDQSDDGLKYYLQNVAKFNSVILEYEIKNDRIGDWYFTNKNGQTLMDIAHKHTNINSIIVFYNNDFKIDQKIVRDIFYQYPFEDILDMLKAVKKKNIILFNVNMESYIGVFRRRFG